MTDLENETEVGKYLLLRQHEIYSPKYFVVAETESPEQLKNDPSYEEDIAQSIMDTDGEVILVKVVENVSSSAETSPRIQKLMEKKWKQLEKEEEQEALA